MYHLVLRGLWAQQLELALEELVISVQWVQHFLHFLCLLGGGLQGLGQLDVRQDQQHVLLCLQKLRGVDGWGPAAAEVVGNDGVEVGGQLLQAAPTVCGGFLGRLHFLQGLETRAICCLLNFPSGIFFTSRFMRAMAFWNTSLLKMLVMSFCVAASKEQGRTR